MMNCVQNRIARTKKQYIHYFNYLTSNDLIIKHNMNLIIRRYSIIHAKTLTKSYIIVGPHSHYVGFYL